MGRVIALIMLFCPVSLYAQCGFPVVFNLLKPESHNYTEQRTNWFFPTVEYIGYPKDSLYVGIGSKVKEQLEKHIQTYEASMKRGIHSHQQGRLKITVCDSNIIKMLFKWHELSSKKESREIVNCYPVIIKNIDTGDIEISIRKMCLIDVEKCGTDGVWKKVNDLSYDCVTGDKRYFIKPGELIVIVFPVAENSIYSRMRFRIGQNYSNVIRLN
jgi:hypothetical protein